MFLYHTHHGLKALGEQLSQATAMPVTVLASTDSSNQQLLNQGSFAPIHPDMPCALIALHQTAGRGRQGRAWQTAAPLQSNVFDPAQPYQAPSFLASLAIRVDMDLPRLSLLPLHLGAAIAYQLRDWGCNATVKWPNDLEVNDAKLGGILLETRMVDGLCLVVMGLGLNWFAAPKVEGRRTSCVALETPNLPEAAIAAAALLQAMHAAWLNTAAGTALDFAGVDALHGKVVCARSTLAGETTQKNLQGTAVGINAAGHLGIRDTQATHWVHSGEVSVVRA